MSNPGVIKLAKEQIGRYVVWLDDNIGESIHLHIDNWRLDFSIKEFCAFCEEIEKNIYRLISKQNIKVDSFDARFLHQLSPLISHIKEIKKERVYLEDLTIIDDNGTLVGLADGALVRALDGEVDINETVHRKSNYIGETNESRMLDSLNFVKEHGYPYNDGYIIIAGRNNRIMDGWHRASSLYHLYGNIEVEVRRCVLDDDGFFDAFCFPARRIKRGDRIILYGAGKVGRKYYEQVKKTKLCDVVAWVDRNYKGITDIMDYPITSPQDIINRDYDYIVVANADSENRKEIYEFLVNMGVGKEKIIV